MSGRIIGEDGGTRFVELSCDYNGYYKVVNQCVAALSTWEGSAVTLQKSNDEGKVTLLQLAKEEMAHLIGAYQTFLNDQEVRQAENNALWSNPPDDLSDLDDGCPF